MDVLANRYAHATIYTFLNFTLYLHNSKHKQKINSCLKYIVLFLKRQQQIQIILFAFACIFSFKSCDDDSLCGYLLYKTTDVLN